MATKEWVELAIKAAEKLKKGGLPNFTKDEGWAEQSYQDHIVHLESHVIELCEHLKAVEKEKCVSLVSAVYRHPVQVNGQTIDMDEVIPLRICMTKDELAQFIGQLTLEPDLGMALWCMTGRWNCAPNFIRIHDTGPDGSVLGEDGHSDDENEGRWDYAPEDLTEAIDDIFMELVSTRVD